MSKFNGIDRRVIKCSDTQSDDTIEAGISFEKLDDNECVYALNFHFLDKVKYSEIVIQKTKSMHLNKENTRQLIQALKALKF